MMSTPHIVLVTDIPDHARNYERALLAGRYEVTVASTAADARIIARARVPDCLVIDERLPDGNGWDLCRELKAEKTCRAVPVVVLSADISSEQAAHSVRVGCDAWIARPAVAEEVVRTIRHVLEAQRSSPPSIEAARLWTLTCPSCSSQEIRAALRISPTQYYKCTKCGFYWRVEVA